MKNLDNLVLDDKGEIIVDLEEYASLIEQLKTNLNDMNCFNALYTIGMDVINFYGEHGDISDSEMGHVLNIKNFSWQDNPKEYEKKFFLQYKEQEILDVLGFCLIDRDKNIREFMNLSRSKDFSPLSIGFHNKETDSFEFFHYFYQTIH